MESRGEQRLRAMAQRRQPTGAPAPSGLAGPTLPAPRTHSTSPQWPGWQQYNMQMMYIELLTMSPNTFHEKVKKNP